MPGVRPSLTFFNEQDAEQLAATFQPEVIRALSSLGAGVSMGLRDLSPARADAVRRLNQANVPVTGWLLLPREQGYFATHHNLEQIEAAYRRLREWTEREHLVLRGIGIDFEPDIRELDELMARPLRTLSTWVFRPGGERVERVRPGYQAFIERVRADGLRVETYQFPTIVDDRLTGSRFWQRTLGALDVEADREVAMLYTSLLGMAGPSLLQSYAPHCKAIAVGSTGGGIDPFPKLSWAELERDLVVASKHSNDLFIFSLEGCLEHQMLERLTHVEWDRSVTPPARVQRLMGATASVVIRQLAFWLG